MSVHRQQYFGLSLFGGDQFGNPEQGGLSVIGEAVGKLLRNIFGKIELTRSGKATDVGGYLTPSLTPDNSFSLFGGDFNEAASGTTSVISQVFLDRLRINTGTLTFSLLLRVPRLKVYLLNITVVFSCSAVLSRKCNCLIFGYSIKRPVYILMDGKSHKGDPDEGYITYMLIIWVNPSLTMA